MSFLTKFLVVLLGLTPLILAVPTELSKRQNGQHCGPGDTFSAGPYTMSVNSWGLKAGVVGKSCLTVTRSSGNTLSFVNDWDWKPNGGVKSFSHANLDVGKRLDTIGSMSASMHWNIEPHGSIVASLGWDIFTGSSPGAIQYEIMLWLGAYGNAAPLARQYRQSDGKPVPSMRNLEIAKHTWDLYIGSNGSQTVYSFVVRNAPLLNFDGDLNAFFKYLRCQNTQNCLPDRDRLSGAQYLNKIQAGVEATFGAATFTAHQYSVQV
uniref:Glycoside hydrolase family 12 protein n=2 Tax=Moniliophthora roreri TaxID=221103 RepID=A0A0W0FM45_MONRR